MSLKEQLNNAMKDAMKARDDLRLSAIRMVRSAVKNREIDTKKELDDVAVTEIITTLIKQRRDSVRLYTEGNRPELAQKEEHEISILLQFMPQQLSADEIEALVIQVIKEIGAETPKDMGRVMKALTPLIAGKADGKTVSDAVRRILT